LKPKYRTAVEIRIEVSVEKVEMRIAYRPSLRCRGKTSKTRPSKTKNNQTGTIKKKGIIVQKILCHTVAVRLVGDKSP
jgi:hypothetical protein